MVVDVFEILENKYAADKFLLKTRGVFVTMSKFHVFCSGQSKGC